jgi:hypothetical protein
MEEPDRIPSVGCLLYLAANQIVPQRPSLTGSGIVKVPCKRRWVHSRRLEATILAASYLSLRDSGHLKLILEDVPDTARRRRPRTTTEVSALVIDAAPPPGLSRVILELASARSRVPTSRSSLFQHLKDPGGRGYISLMEAAKDELVELGYANYRAAYFRPDCGRLATLDIACTDAIRWWRTVEAAEVPLFDRLWAACWAACRHEGGG